MNIRAALTVSLGFLTVLHAQDTGVTYQGRLQFDGAPANGRYEFRFTVFDAATAGSAQSTTVETGAVDVTNGLFVTVVDLGADAFGAEPRWLDIAVRTNETAAAFETMSPRQRVTAAPRALTALNALNAQSAASAATAVTASAVAPSSVTAAGLAAGSVTSASVAPGQVVLSLNGLRDEVSLAAGPGISIATNGLALSLGTTAWLAGGNAGTQAGVDFLGTTDDQALELRANNLRGLRLEPQSLGAIVNVIGGHGGNTVAAGISGATIAGGGAFYSVDADYAHHISALYGTIGGGMGHRIEANAASSTICGGFSNAIGNFAPESVIVGGSLNRIGADAMRGTISGGWQQTIADGAYHSTIGGGWTNTVGAHSSTIAGGVEQSIAVGSQFSTIGGGAGHVIEPDARTVTIAGGARARVQTGAERSFIGGGADHVIGAAAGHAVIAGGLSNRVESAAAFGTIPGGEANQVSGAYGFAAGRRARAESGAFVWADATDADFTSTNANEFAARATGGARFVSSVDGLGQPLTGVVLPPGSGSWSTLSDRGAKTNVVSADSEGVLAGVKALPLATWSYRGEGPAIRHLGPMAQDFRAAFGLGGDERTIATVDADGVALAAIQALLRRVEAQDVHLAAQARRLEALEAALKVLRTHAGPVVPGVVPTVD